MTIISIELNNQQQQTLLQMLRYAFHAASMQVDKPGGFAPEILEQCERYAAVVNLVNIAIEEESDDRSELD